MKAQRIFESHCYKLGCRSYFPDFFLLCVPEMAANHPMFSVYGTSGGTQVLSDAEKQMRLTELLNSSGVESPLAMPHPTKVALDVDVRYFSVNFHKNMIASRLNYYDDHWKPTPVCDADDSELDISDEEEKSRIRRVRASARFPIVIHNMDEPVHRDGIQWACMLAENHITGLLDVEVFRALVEQFMLKRDSPKVLPLDVMIRLRLDVLEESLRNKVVAAASRAGRSALVDVIVNRRFPARNFRNIGDEATLKLMPTLVATLTFGAVKKALDAMVKHAGLDPAGPREEPMPFQNLRVEFSVRARDDLAAAAVAGDVEINEQIEDMRMRETDAFGNERIDARALEHQLSDFDWPKPVTVDQVVLFPPENTLLARMLALSSSGFLNDPRAGEALED